jgi:hypothetical protein
MLSHCARVGFAFDYAGTRNEEERVGAAEAERVQRDFVSCGHAESVKIA